MGLSAAAIAMISGVIVEELSYAALAIVAAALVAPMIVALMTSGRDCDAAR